MEVALTFQNIIIIFYEVGKGGWWILNEEEKIN